MRAILIAAAAALLTTSGAMAQDPAPAPDESSVANLVGNTLIIKNPKGVISTIVHNADHTFAGSVPELNYKFKGVWQLNEKGELCRTFRPPIPNQPKTQCGPTMQNLPFGYTYTAPNGAVLVLRQGS